MLVENTNVSCMQHLFHELMMMTTIFISYGSKNMQYMFMHNLVQIYKIEVVPKLFLCSYKTPI